MNPLTSRHIGPAAPEGFDPIERFVISAPRTGGSGGGGGAVTLPFKINDTSPDAVTPKINVVTGTVMDITPTNVATDRTCTANATNTFYLDCTIDADGLVTAVTLSHATTGKPADSTYHAYLLVGTAAVDVDGLISLIEQSLYFSQGFKACDRDPEDPATTPGTYQFFVR